MTQIVIRVENLGKRYRLGQVEPYKTLRDALTNLAKTPMRRRSSLETESESPTGKRESHRHIWALRNVSFGVEEGEVLGVIGPNGAGKTTLLKVLSRITEPTEGRAYLGGRVGSLLEVGTGFHPELTGKENIYLNGAILGMKRREIEAKLEEIVQFSELGEFMDTPLKRYSAGMRVRLAFSVAAHLEPEILLVDEVLAVGDAAFRRKCMGKMQDVAKLGRTVLLVSHDMASILSLCDRAILLDKGQIVKEGSPEEVVDEYMASALQSQGERVWQEGSRSPSSDTFRPLAVRILNERGVVSGEVLSSESFLVEVEYEILESVVDLRIGVSLSTDRGEILFLSFDRDDAILHSEHRVRDPGRFVSRCRIPANLLNGGRYVVGINAGIYNTARLFEDTRAATLTVDDRGGVGSHWPESRRGSLKPAMEWEIECVSPLPKNF